MNTKKFFRCVLVLMSISLSFILFSGGAFADPNYVVVDHQEMIPLEANFTNTVDGAATSYTRRGPENFSVGYYVEDGNIISGHSLLEGDGPVDFDLDLIAYDNNVIYDSSDPAPGSDIIFNPVIATGAGTDIVLTGSIDAYDDSYGQNASDFSGRGTMIIATNGAKVTVDSMKIFTEGFQRSAFIADSGGHIIVKDSKVTVMGANPLTEAYDDYYNSANQNIMLSPPWVLGIQGGARLANMLGPNPTLTLIGSKASSGGWAVLSTDAGSNMVMNVVDSKLEILPESKGGMSSGDFSYSKNYGSGYGTYLIGGATQNFYGTTFHGTTYACILRGGTASYMSSYGDLTLIDAVGDEMMVQGEGNVTNIHSVFGFMTHGGGTINVLDGTVVQSEEATFLYKNGGVNFAVDDAVLQPKSGIILQMMDDDDPTIGGFNPFNDFFEEKEGWPSEWEDTPAISGGSNTVTLSLKNGNYQGDVFNGTGGNPGYDMRGNLYTQPGDALEVTIGQDAKLKGAITLTETQHIVKYFEIEQYYYLGHVVNRNYRNDSSTIDITVEQGGVWEVTGESLLSSLTLDGGSITGAKGYKVVMTVDGDETPIMDGITYSGDIVISLVKSGKK